MSVQMALQAAQLSADFGKALGDPSVAALFGPISYFASDPEKRLKEQTAAWNRQVTNNVARSLFDLERQRISERMRTTSAVLGYNAHRSTTLSTLRSQYAAVDVIGSSSNALKQAYAFQLDQAIAQENFNFGVGIDNYNTSILQVVNQGLGQLRYDYKPQNQQSMSPNSISNMMQKGMSMFGGQGGGGMFSGVNNGASGGILGTGSGGGYSGTTMGMGNISNVNFGGGGSLGIA